MHPNHCQKGSGTEEQKERHRETDSRFAEGWPELLGCKVLYLSSPSHWDLRHVHSMLNSEKAKTVCVIAVQF